MVRLCAIIVQPAQVCSIYLYDKNVDDCRTEIPPLTTDVPVYYIQLDRFCKSVKEETQSLSNRRPENEIEIDIDKEKQSHDIRRESQILINAKNINYI